MTDRQIEVLEKIHSAMENMLVIIEPSNHPHPLVRELEEIIEDQKLINLKSFRDEKK